MAHADLDQLLNVVLEFANKMLNEHGEFFPFGSSMDLNSKITMDGAATGEDRPPSEELIDLLSKAYAQRAAAGELRAVAICADVRVVPPGKVDKTDAISVGLEHQSGEAVTVFQPYRKARGASELRGSNDYIGSPRRSSSRANLHSKGRSLMFAGCGRVTRHPQVDVAGLVVVCSVTNP